MNLWNKFWSWYDRHYKLNVAVTAILFSWQLVHLYWLTANVVANRLLGHSYLQTTDVWNTILILVDYTEIPALITTSLLYISELRKQFSWKNIWFLIFLNSQWLHLFWITDEFVVERFSDAAKVTLPVWLAWVAILIDYLELPVIYDTLKKFFKADFLARNPPQYQKQS